MAADSGFSPEIARRPEAAGPRAVSLISITRLVGNEKLSLFYFCNSTQI